MNIDFSEWDVCDASRKDEWQKKREKTKKFLIKVTKNSIYQNRMKQEESGKAKKKQVSVNVWVYVCVGYIEKKLMKREIKR